MSNVRDSKVHGTDQDNSQKSKRPTHVRKLNFGQSILTLDPVKQFQGQKDGMLLMNKNVTSIPCTEKIDFVRKWIESHEECILSSENALQTSPTLGSSATDRAETSPVFGKRRKRVRKKSNLNDTVIDSHDRTRSSKLQCTIRKEISNPYVETNKRMKIDYNSRTENVRKNLFNSPPITARLETSQTNTSPVFNKTRHGYKRRRKKCTNENPQRKVLVQIENKRMETSIRDTSFDKGIHGQYGSPILVKNCYHSNRRKGEVQSNRIDSNMNSIESYNLENELRMGSSFKIMCTQKQRDLIKKLEKSLNSDDLKSSTSKDSKISEDFAEIDSTGSHSKLHIEDSPREIKDSVKMEIESSNSNDDNCNDIVNTSSETDKDLSELIEDTDMQDIEPIIENSIHGSTRSFGLIVSNADSRSSQISTKDSDETYFEKAEELGRMLSNKHNNPQTSQEISQVSSQVNDLTEVKSTQSGIIISTETSPGKTYPDLSVQLNLLDSGKKRKKPKRGSLSERLQSAINRQVSFVRVWKYQLKQMDKDNVSVPCVTVCVHACVTRFGRQFLEGIVMEDSFQLLSSTGRNVSSKLIKIMTIPNIVGKVEIKSAGMVQIFPPWEVLDNNKLIVLVTYIRVAPDNDKDIELNTINANRVKDTIVKEFSCPCMDANRMISYCTDRSNKPDVIENLFTD